MKQALVMFLAGLLVGGAVGVAVGRHRAERPAVTVAVPPAPRWPRPELPPVEPALSRPATVVATNPPAAPVSSNPVPPAAAAGPVPIQYLPPRLQAALHQYETLTEPRQRIDLVKTVVGLTEAEAKGPEIAGVLGQFLRQETESEVKLEILDDLALLNEPTALDQVLPALDAHQPREVRLAGIQTLENLADLRAKPWLQQLLTDPDTDLRQAAQKALDALPDE